VADVVALPSVASRLKLVGVASAGAQRGAALIGIDGQTPKPYRIGQEVVDGLVLQSVDRLGARLGVQVGGPSALQLDMPLPRQP
jgi:general secretion pathway protein C